MAGDSESGVAAGPATVLWAVVHPDGRRRELSALGWFDAFVRAGPELGLPVGQIGALDAHEQEDGAFHVHVEGTGVFRLRALQPTISGVVAGAASKLDEDIVELRDSDWTEELFTDELRGGVLHMPAASFAQEFESFEERLFSSTIEIESGPVRAGCRLVLELLAASVRPRGAVIVRGTLNDRDLVAFAASGPAAAELEGKRQAHGLGPIGMCFDLLSLVELDHLSAGALALDPVGSGADYSVLCIPIVDTTELGRGVLAVVHDAGHGFSPADHAVLQTLARALAARLART